VPKQAFHIVTGPGGTVGDELYNNPDVDGLTFTGSYTVGMEIYHHFAKDYLSTIADYNALVIPSLSRDGGTSDLRKKFAKRFCGHGRIVRWGSGERHFRRCGRRLDFCM
jgi:hypothetical protein